MSDSSAYLCGQIEKWPSKKAMAAILRAARLQVVEGQYSLRIEDCSHFVFQEYGGDLSEPCVEADAASADALLREATLVSDALARAGIKHRFEIYDEARRLAGYLHHDWPLTGSASS